MDVGGRKFWTLQFWITYGVWHEIWQKSSRMVGLGEQKHVYFEMLQEHDSFFKILSSMWEGSFKILHFSGIWKNIIFKVKKTKQKQNNANINAGLYLNVVADPGTACWN